MRSQIKRISTVVASNKFEASTHAAIEFVFQPFYCFPEHIFCQTMLVYAKDQNYDEEQLELDGAPVAITESET